jgi:hypothetical protein
MPTAKKPTLSTQEAHYDKLIATIPEIERRATPIPPPL